MKLDNFEQYITESNNDTLYYHGSFTSGIKQFKLMQTNKILVFGAGIYLASSKKSATAYGIYIYAVNIKNLNIAPVTFKFTDSITAQFKTFVSKLDTDVIINYQILVDITLSKLIEYSFDCFTYDKTEGIAALKSFLYNVLGFDGITYYYDTNVTAVVC